MKNKKIFLTAKAVLAYGHPTSLRYDATGRAGQVRLRQDFGGTGRPIRGQSCLIVVNRACLMKSGISKKANENAKIKPN
jgi:hypothetical protein